MRNCLTVDVEDWFHVCGAGPALSPGRWDALPSRVLPTTRDLLALFDRHRVRATFFVLGWIAERYPELVQEIAAAGHELASHGHWHTRVYEMTADQFAADLERSVDAIATAGGARIAGFRAPEWSINDRSLWALDVLAQKGFRYDSSMAPLRVIGNPAYPRGRHTRTTSHGVVMEFPPFVGRRLGQNVPLGGGWGLRMSKPHDVLTRLESANRAGQAAVFWIHPWEIDPDPPRVRLPWAKRFAHYFQLQGFKQRFEEVVAHGNFGPVGELASAR